MEQLGVTAYGTLIKSGIDTKNLKLVIKVLSNVYIILN